MLLSLFIQFSKVIIIQTASFIPELRLFSFSRIQYQNLRQLSLLIGLLPRRLVRLSNFYPYLPRQYLIRKLNLARNLAQRAQRRFSYFIVIKYLRFLQLVSTLTSSPLLESSGLYSLKALTIASSSLLYILQLHSYRLIFFKKYTTSYRPLVIGSRYKRTPATI